MLETWESLLLWESRAANLTCWAQKETTVRFKQRNWNAFKHEGYTKWNPFDLKDEISGNWTFREQNIQHRSSNSQVQVRQPKGYLSIWIELIHFQEVRGSALWYDEHRKSYEKDKMANYSN